MCMSVTCVFGMSFSLNKLSYFFGMSVGVYTWYVISLKFFICLRPMFLVCHIPKNIPTFLVCLKVMFPVCVDYSKNLVLFRYIFNLCFRYDLKNDISKTY